MSLKGKVALVTGASRGIGRAVAERLAADGADVAVVYSSNQAAADEVCVNIELRGVRSKAYQCDVADPEACRQLVKAVNADLGPVSVLVNNAGIIHDGITASLTEEQFGLVLDVNLKGAYHLIKECYFGFLRQRSGSIINMSSVSGLMGGVGQSNYAAAKAGLIGMTKSVARELAERGVRCNAVAPGVIATDMTSEFSDDPGRLDAIPMRRAGRPEDVAAVVSFLAGDASSYITGEVIRVDGGLAM